MMSPVILELSYTPPYDWCSMLEFLSARAVPGVERVWSGGYARTFALQGTQGVLAVEPQGGQRARLTVQIADAEALQQVSYRVRRLFDLDTDPRPVDAHLRGDTLLGALVSAHPGLRVPGTWDGFELAVRAVLGQQITVAAATTLAGRLVHAHGEHLTPALQATPLAAGLTHLFPDPARLMTASITGMPRSRSKTLAELATAVLREPGLFGGYGSLQEGIARLRSLSGVGEWTAHYIAMRALREPDAFPSTDIALQRVLAVNDERPSPAEILERAEAWRPWRAYAALHLWSALARCSRDNRCAA